jgi:hypothetical protein
VELVRSQVDAVDSGDIGAMTSFFAVDAVNDSSPRDSDRPLSDLGLKG